MMWKSVKQWVGVALLLAALLHGDSLRDGPGKEWPSRPQVRGWSNPGIFRRRNLSRRGCFRLPKKSLLSMGFLPDW